MTDRKRRRDWAIDGVSEEARRAAVTAASAAGAALEIWIAETVLNACQEREDGKGAAESIAAGPASGND